MMDSTSQIAVARQRFSELETDVLREMWSTEGRTDWAETALREELLERGASADELEDVAARRAQIAANAPPSARDTLWKYGVVGRGATMIGIILWCVLAKVLNDSGKLAIVGAVAILGTYVYVLTRRTTAQNRHEVRASASFAIKWQLCEAWLFLIGTLIGAGFMFLG